MSQTQTGASQLLADIAAGQGAGGNDAIGTLFEDIKAGQTQPRVPAGALPASVVNQQNQAAPVQAPLTGTPSENAATWFANNPVRPTTYQQNPLGIEGAAPAMPGLPSVMPTGTPGLSNEDIPIVGPAMHLVRAATQTPGEKLYREINQPRVDGVGGKALTVGRFARDMIFQGDMTVRAGAQGLEETGDPIFALGYAAITEAFNRVGLKGADKVAGTIVRSLGGRIGTSLAARGVTDIAAHLTSGAADGVIRSEGQAISEAVLRAVNSAKEAGNAGMDPGAALDIALGQELTQFVKNQPDTLLTGALGGAASRLPGVARSAYEGARAGWQNRMPAREGVRPVDPNTPLGDIIDATTADTQTPRTEPTDGSTPPTPAPEPRVGSDAGPFDFVTGDGVRPDGLAPVDGPGEGRRPEPDAGEGPQAGEGATGKAPRGGRPARAETEGDAPKEVKPEPKARGQLVRRKPKGDDLETVGVSQGGEIRGLTPEEQAAVDRGESIAPNKVASEGEAIPPEWTHTVDIKGKPVAARIVEDFGDGKGTVELDLPSAAGGKTSRQPMTLSALRSIDSNPTEDTPLEKGGTPTSVAPTTAAGGGESAPPPGKPSVTFRSIPPKAVRDRLKAGGFAWNKESKAWEGPDTPEAHSVAQAISGERDAFLASRKAGASAEAPTPAKAPTPIGTKPSPAKANADKLRTLAQSRHDRAQEVLNADRQVNTARRARIAEGVTSDALGEQTKAEQMRKLADAIEQGNGPALEGVKNAAMFESILALRRKAQYERWSSLRDTPAGKKMQSEGKDWRHLPVDEEALNRLHFTGAAEVHPENYRRFLDDVSKLPKSKAAVASLRRALGGDRVYLSGATLDLASQWAGKLGTSSASYVKDAAKEGKRFRELGIDSSDKAREVLRQFEAAVGGVKKPEASKLAKMEGALAGRKSIGHDFFPTPPAVAADLVQRADVKKGMRVLEPSAGHGRIADAIKAEGVDPDTVEASSELAAILKEKGHNVVEGDFMAHNPGAVYDRVVMNPPFSGSEDIDHVRHAFDLLKPGGRLVAIMGEGTFFRSDKKATAFRAWLDSLGGESEKLPEGTFATDKQGLPTTGVASRIVTVDKPEGSSPAPAEKPQAPAAKPTSSPSAEPADYTAALEKTPAGRQYLRFKKSHPDALLVFRMGDFYEAFANDAIAIHKALGYTLTSRGGVPMVGFPYATLDMAARKIIAAGHRLAVADQIDNKEKTDEEAPEKARPETPEPPARKAKRVPEKAGAIDPANRKPTGIRVVVGKDFVDIADLDPTDPTQARQIEEAFDRSFSRSGRPAPGVTLADSIDWKEVDWTKETARKTLEPVKAEEQRQAEEKERAKFIAEQEKRRSEAHLITGEEFARAMKGLAKGPSTLAGRARLGQKTRVWVYDPANAAEIAKRFVDAVKTTGSTEKKIGPRPVARNAFKVNRVSGNVDVLKRLRDLGLTEKEAKKSIQTMALSGYSVHSGDLYVGTRSSAIRLPKEKPYTWGKDGIFTASGEEVDPATVHQVAPGFAEAFKDGEESPALNPGGQGIDVPIVDLMEHIRNAAALTTKDQPGVLLVQNPGENWKRPGGLVGAASREHEVGTAEANVDEGHTPLVYVDPDKMIDHLQAMLDLGTENVNLRVVGKKGAEGLDNRMVYLDGGSDVQAVVMGMSDHGYRPAADDTRPPERGELAKVEEPPAEEEEADEPKKPSSRGGRHQRPGFIDFSGIPEGAGALYDVVDQATKGSRERGSLIAGAATRGLRYVLGKSESYVKRVAADMRKSEAGSRKYAEVLRARRDKEAKFADHYKKQRIADKAAAHEEMAQRLNDQADAAEARADAMKHSARLVDRITYAGIPTLIRLTRRHAHEDIKKAKAAWGALTAAERVRVGEAGLKGDPKGLSTKEEVAFDALRDVMDNGEAGLARANAVGYVRIKPNGQYGPVGGSGRWMPLSFNAEGRAVLADIHRTRLSGEPTARMMKAAASAVNQGLYPDYDAALTAFKADSAAEIKSPNGYFTRTRAKWPVEYLERDVAKVLPASIERNARTIAAAEAFGGVVKDPQDRGEANTLVDLRNLHNVLTSFDEATAKTITDHLAVEVGGPSPGTPIARWTSGKVTGAQNLLKLLNFKSWMQNTVDPLLIPGATPSDLWAAFVSHTPLFAPTMTARGRAAEDLAARAGAMVPYHQHELDFEHMTRRGVQALIAPVNPFARSQAGSEIRAALIAQRVAVRMVERVAALQNGTGSKMRNLLTVLANGRWSMLANPSRSNEIAAEAIKERLGEHGMTPKEIDAAVKKGSLTGDEIDRLVFSIVREFMGTPDAGTRPIWWHSAIGQWMRPFFQFKGFTLRRAEMFYKRVLREAWRGNPFPLAAAVAAGLIGRELIALLGDWLFGQKQSVTGAALRREEANAIASRAVTHIGQAGLTGPFTDIYQHGLPDWVAGPTGSTIGNTLDTALAIGKEPTLQQTKLAIAELVRREAVGVRQAEQLTKTLDRDGAYQFGNIRSAAQAWARDKKAEETDTSDSVVGGLIRGIRGKGTMDGGELYLAKKSAARSIDGFDPKAAEGIMYESLRGLDPAKFEKRVAEWKRAATTDSPLGSIKQARRNDYLDSLPDAERERASDAAARWREMYLDALSQAKERADTR